jgi:hypothetical protein
MKQDIINWLDTIERIDGIPPVEVIAFNFGLYEDETGYKVYLAGSFEYDEDDDDWAAVEPPTGLHRHLSLPDNLQSETWEFVLDSCANALTALESEERLNMPLLKNAIAITTGFDEGDLIKIR